MIPNDELTKGIRLCRKNVSALLGDARALYRRKNYGHAMSLAITAMEEFAKEVTLIREKLYPGAFNSEVRDTFRIHRLKIEIALEWLRTEILGKNLDTPSKEETDEMVRNLVVFRTACLYVGFTKAEGWNDPNKPDLEGVALQQIHGTEILVQASDKRIIAMVPELAEDRSLSDQEA
jgi:AbiV family abortive infection protein